MRITFGIPLFIGFTNMLLLLFFIPGRIKSEQPFLFAAIFLTFVLCIALTFHLTDQCAFEETGR